LAGDVKKRVFLIKMQFLLYKEWIIGNCIILAGESTQCLIDSLTPKISSPHQNPSFEPRLEIYTKNFDFENSTQNLF